MTERTYQVGDVLVWPNVPNRSFVKTRRSNMSLTNYYVRLDDRGWWVGGTPKLGEPESFIDVPPVGNGWPAWNKWRGTEEMATIVALDVPADATADDLRTLAEVFEVRENLLTLARWPDAPLSDDIYETIGQMAARREDWQTWLAKLLHRIGWRPGMTAEDAARMLAEGCT